MKISLVGNCQTQCYSYFLKMLMPEEDIYWCAYRDPLPWNWMRDDYGVYHIGVDDGVKHIEESDVVIYQPIASDQTSEFYHMGLMENYISDSAKSITVPIVVFDVEKDYDSQIRRLRRKENFKSMEIKAVPYFQKYKDRTEDLMLNYNHPTTFLFLEILREVCLKMDFPFFEDERYNELILERNFMELPC